MKKVTTSWMYSLAIMGVFLMIISSCQKKADSNPPTGGTVTDIDGNVYHTVTIGTQTWMVENLRTTRYNNGAAIPLVTEGEAWSALTTPGYCWYKNDETTFKPSCGALYNWYAVATGKLCPTGWHVPTVEEWTTLATYLGGDTLAGGKMKSTGTIGAGTGLWQDPNTGATNESGFTAIPAGFRYRNYGVYDYFGSLGFLWSSSEVSTINAWGQHLQYNYKGLTRYSHEKVYGFSVRCIRDV
ncbi:MAG: FISUMP domain-containing protein [Bacteroidales bacterium]